MKYSPKKNNTALCMSMATLITGLAVMFFSHYAPFSPFVFQIISIALFTLAIQLMQRYQLSDFHYIIDDKDNGESILTVVKSQGKKTTTVCSVSCTKCVYAGKSADFKEKTVNSFDYRQNVFSNNDFILIYKDANGYITIKLEPNEAFKAELKSRINLQN